MMLLFVLESVGIGSTQPSSSSSPPMLLPSETIGEQSISTSTNSPESDSQNEPPATSAPVAKSSSAAFVESLTKFDVLVEESIEPHDPDIFFKCCKTLSDLVRSDVHITAANFSVCIHCMRTFSEVSGCGLALEHEASMGRLVVN